MLTAREKMLCVTQTRIYAIANQDSIQKVVIQPTAEVSKHLFLLLVRNSYSNCVFDRHNHISIVNVPLFKLNLLDHYTLEIYSMNMPYFSHVVENFNVHLILIHHNGMN